MARGIETKCLHLEEEEGCSSNYGDDGAVSSGGSFDCGCRPLWVKHKTFS